MSVPMWLRLRRAEQTVVRSVLSSRPQARRSAPLRGARSREVLQGSGTAESCAFHARQAAAAAKEAATKAAETARGLKVTLEALLAGVARHADEAAAAARAAETRALAGDPAAARRSWQESEQRASRAICAGRRFRALEGEFLRLVAKSEDQSEAELPQPEGLPAAGSPGGADRFALLEID